MRGDVCHGAGRRASRGRWRAYQQYRRTGPAAATTPTTHIISSSACAHHNKRNNKNNKNAHQAPRARSERSERGGDNKKGRGVDTSILVLVYTNTMHAYASSLILGSLLSRATMRADADCSITSRSIVAS